MLKKHANPPRKTVLYRLCEFLVEYRLSEAGDGINNPIEIPKRALFGIASPNEYNELNKKIGMLSQEIKDNGLPLLEILKKNSRLLLLRYKRNDIENYKKSLLSGDEETIKSQERRNREGKPVIRKITVVKPSDPDERKPKIILNDIYDESFEVSSNKWKKIIAAIEDKKSGGPGQIAGDKNFIDYYNHNKNNRLYSGEGYQFTKILILNPDNKIIINPDIETETITALAYNRRLNNKNQ